MTHRERVLGAIQRRGFDRIPVKYDAAEEIDAALMRELHLPDRECLLDRLGDDFRYVAPRHKGGGPAAEMDMSLKGLWGEEYVRREAGGGSIYEVTRMPYAEISTATQLQALPRPTADWFDFSGIRADCEARSGYAVVCGEPGHMDFINGIARCRGFDTVLMDIADENPVYLALVEQRAEFFQELYRRSLEAARGGIDFVHVGEDVATQRGLLLSREKFLRLFGGAYRRFFDMVHAHGARVLFHSCGAVAGLIPDLIDLGVDVLDVVQVNAQGMALERLKTAFGADICFCGTICTQKLLVFGTAADVQREVRKRVAMFETGGLIIAPTHSIAPGTPLPNILAAYDTATSTAARIFP
ncbi:MAG TPA: uroporphyrinogen decarboxylase family protein [Spirochaetia bacterium]|nr:uroporphyrinogen decarboxylase family protein [Spirochaetia bacterium]